MSRLASAQQLVGQRSHLVAPQRAHRCPATGLAPRQVRSTGAVRCQASKGFGQSPQKTTKPIEDGPVVPGQSESRSKTAKFKGKRSRRQGPTSQPAQQFAQSAGGGAVQPGFNPLAGPAVDDGPRENLVDKIEFEQRLKQLKQESEARKQEQQRTANSSSIIDSPRWQQQDEDIYANVQPLSKTLLPRDDSGAAKEYEGSQFGPPQAGLAVAAVLLGAVFLLTSGGGDLGPSTRRQQPAVGVQQQQLGDEQRADLEQQLVTFQEQLAADGGNAEALESVAVINARLGNFAEAEKQLVQLAGTRPGDPEVLRVLAETQGAQAEFPAAVDSYRKAWEACGKSRLDVLQGLAGALVADGKEAAAIETIQAAQAEGGSSVGSAELQLLAGKTYAQWRGHVPDAIAVYDKLIETSPEDFRAYLAKGLLLKDQGRAGDAERYYIQAKFYAKESKGLVDQIIQSRQ